ERRRERCACVRENPSNSRPDATGFIDQVYGSDAGRAILNSLLAFGELIRARLPMERHLIDIATNKPLIEDAAAEIKIILTEQSRLVVDGIRTADEQARFNRLRQRFAYFQGERQKYFDADRTSHGAIQAAVAEVTKKAITWQRNLIDARVQVLALLRKELGFKFDVEEYRRSQTQMATIAIDDLDRTMKSVSEVFFTDDT
ncbi:MAG: hypothetical protein ABI227_08770, partial [Rhodanobacter sp.]